MLCFELIIAVEIFGRMQRLLKRFAW